MIGTLVAVTLIVAAVAGARGTWSPCGLSMVSAINPLAERGRGYRYWLTAAWFAAGAVTGGALLGAVAAVPAVLATPAPRLPLPAAAVLGGVGCLVAVSSDCRLGGFELPIHPRQVNERWLTQYRRWLYATGFGLQIGTGFATYIMTAATYLLVWLAALTALAGYPWWALVTGSAFGLVRGSAVLLSSRCRTPESLRRVHRRLHSLEPASRRWTVTVEVAVAVILTAAVGGWVPVVILLVAGCIAGNRSLARSRTRTGRREPRRNLLPARQQAVTPFGPPVTTPPSEHAV